MKEKFDFEELKGSIEFAVRKCFEENIEKYGSSMCAFALISDDGAMTVVPCTNTVEHLKRMQGEDVEYKDDYEFCPVEWFSDDGANVEFNAICEILANEVLREDWDFIVFKKALFECCVQVLEKLRKEQFFPDDLFVLFSISDTFESVENQIQWAKRLNSGEIVRRFEAWIINDGI